MLLKPRLQTSFEEKKYREKDTTDKTNVVIRVKLFLNGKQTLKCVRDICAGLFSL